MPNYVSNRLTIVANSKERMDEIISTLKGENGEIDFRNIIPVPEDLVYENNLYPVDDQTERGLANKKKYGYPNAYEFCVGEWGTKWNAECLGFNRNSGDEVIYDFLTAWDEPEGIYKKLTEMFPDIELHALFSDEDPGNGCGKADYQDGRYSIKYAPRNSDLAFDIYFEFNDRDEWIKTKEGWMMIEEAVEEGLVDPADI